MAAFMTKHVHNINARSFIRGRKFIGWSRKYSSVMEGSLWRLYRGADKSLARPGRKQATATEDFEFHIAYL
jgi:hypothetical protein